MKSEFDSPWDHSGKNKATTSNEVVALFLVSEFLHLRAAVIGGAMSFLPFLGRKTSEPGSRTLSRFGVVDEQIYLVIRDHTAYHLFPI
jgi:hypothetical protein